MPYLTVIMRSLAAPLPKGKECWYLSLFGLYHPKKPDQIRVAFGASAQYEGISLNSLLLTGPDLNNSLLGVLMHFKKDCVAAMTDIQQMFGCFVVREDHIDFTCVFCGTMIMTLTRKWLSTG